MKYVGATDWFIRWPFVVEGIVIGIVIAAVRSTYDKNAEKLRKKGGIGYILLSILNARWAVYW